MLRSPELWSCTTCGSTDGVWVCLTCGHVGCGQRAHHPLLGGGHALHHHFASGGRHALCVDAVHRTSFCHACDEYINIDPSRWMTQLPTGSTQHQSAPACAAVPENNLSYKSRLPGAAAGLNNLGNTCFMNSTLQALAHLDGVRSFFHDFVKGETSSAPLTLGSIVVARQDTPAWKKQAESRAKQPLASALHGLLRAGWSGRYSSISPHAFVHAVWERTALFEVRILPC